MIWNVAEQISQLSEAFELMPGDTIYSGTPENVGPVVKGDVIECHIDKLPNLSVKFVWPAETSRPLQNLVSARTRQRFNTALDGLDPSPASHLYP